MSKIKLELTRPQLATIEEALDMLGSDYDTDTATGRKIHKNIERVTAAIAKAKPKYRAVKATRPLIKNFGCYCQGYHCPGDCGPDDA